MVALNQTIKSLNHKPLSILSIHYCKTNNSSFYQSCSECPEENVYSGLIGGSKHDISQQAITPPITAEEDITTCPGKLNESAANPSIDAEEEAKKKTHIANDTREHQEDVQQVPREDSIVVEQRGNTTVILRITEGASNDSTFDSNKDKKIGQDAEGKIAENSNLKNNEKKPSTNTHGNSKDSDNGQHYVLRSESGAASVDNIKGEAAAPETLQSSEKDRAGQSTYHTASSQPLTSNQPQSTHSDRRVTNPDTEFLTVIFHALLTPTFQFNPKQGDRIFICGSFPFSWKDPQYQVEVHIVR